MNKMTVDLVPDGYPFCIVADCPVDELCTPEDIATIQYVLQELGLQHLGFDAYERHFNW